jgi:16S rRNA (cytidine1402-2'-O)-methyltransferase
MSTIYLIPNLLGDADFKTSLPEGVVDVVRSLKNFIVEDEKNARKFLKLCGVMPPYDDIAFYVLDKHTSSSERSEILKEITDKESGIISEAGCPAIADPGADIIAMAHQRNFTVRPLVGPSSILMALIASGFNGQAFNFHGYLPVTQLERVKRVKELEADSAKTGYTQIFIETPFRNESMFSDILANCKPTTLLSVACDITLPTEEIKSANIKEWQKIAAPALRGRPSVFSLLVIKGNY